MAPPAVRLALTLSCLIVIHITRIDAVCERKWQVSQSVQLLDDSKCLSENKQVAFTARFSEDSLRVDNDTPYIFDVVVTNIGNGYDPATGVFTAPVDGIYIFFLNIMGLGEQGRGVIHSAIEKSGIPLCSVAVQGPTPPFDKGNCVATAHLNASDTVWVQRTAGDNYIKGSWWSSISGVLISPTCH